MPDPTAVNDPVPDAARYRRSAGATWVAATGAAMVLTAAGVLVASRWDRLSDVVKLAILLAGTAACAVLGHRLKPTLPATGNVVFHLGVFLVPANVAAVLVHLGASAGQHLVLQGAIGAAVFALAAGVAESRVLRWAAYVMVPVLCFGVGALTPVPALVALGLCALAARFLPDLGARDAALPWGLATAFGPTSLLVIASVLPYGFVADASAALQITLGSLAASAWLVGVLGAVVVGACARERDEVELGFTAIASLVIGVVHTAFVADIGASNALLAAAGAFVLVEVLAIVAASDRFWREPVTVFAALVEALAGLVFVPFVVAAIALGVIHDAAVPAPDVAVVIALFTVAAGVFVADARRAGTQLLAARGSGVAVVGIAASVTAGVLATGVASWMGAAVLAGAFVACVAAKRAADPLALVAGPIAVGLAHAAPGVAVAAGLGCVATAAFRARSTDRAGVVPGLVVASAVATTLLAAAVSGVPAAPAMVAASLALAALAAYTDAIDRGDIARIGLLVPVAVAAVVSERDALTITLAVAAVLVIDGVRLRRPELLVVGVATSYGSVVAAAMLAGLSVGHAGVAVALSAVVWAGIGAVLGDGFDAAFACAAGIGCLVALVLGVNDPQSFAITLLIVGGLGVAAGVLTGVDAVTHTGAIAIALGLITHLSVHEVKAVEWYLAPVSLHLAVAGEIARRRRAVSSWVATAPGPLLLAGAALLERLDGGSAPHALVAAVVAGAMVAVGGRRRQAGPLFCGTGVLAALALHESYSALVGVPAWGWIGVVGVALLGAAVCIERADVHPLQVGRRLVDVISDQFD